MNSQHQNRTLLVAHPVSSRFLQGLQSKLDGQFNTLSLQKLRQLGVLDMIKKLRSEVKPILLVAVEDESSRALIPLLIVMASISSAKRIAIIDGDLQTIYINRLYSIAYGLQILSASINGFLAVWKTQREVRKLLKTEQLNISKPIGGNTVLYLKTNFWFGTKIGGSVGHVAGIVNGLVDSNVNVEFVSVDKPTLLRNSVKVHQVKTLAAAGLPSEFVHYLLHHRLLRDLSWQEFKGNYAFVYQRLSVGNFAGIYFSRRLKVPFVLEYNGSEVWISRNWGNQLAAQELALDVERALLMHAHWVITVSEVLRDELLERGVSTEKIVVYPNCVDLEFFSPNRFSKNARDQIRVQHGIDVHTTLVTFIGTFGRWHGAELLAKAVVKVSEEEPALLDQKKLHFMFVGDGMTMPEVRQILGGLIDSEFVTLTGLVPQEEAPLYLAASDILVAPNKPNADGSKFFGSPTKLFEYMAMGKAILASNLDQLGEVLSPGIRVEDISRIELEDESDAVALLAKPGEVNDLVSGLIFLVENPELASCLGRNAREIVLSRYTWKHHVAAILDAVDGTTGKH